MTSYDLKTKHFYTVKSCELIPFLTFSEITVSCQIEKSLLGAELVE